MGKNQSISYSESILRQKVLATNRTQLRRMKQRRTYLWWNFAAIKVSLRLTATVHCPEARPTPRPPVVDPANRKSLFGPLGTFGEICYSHHSFEIGRSGTGIIRLSPWTQAPPVFTWVNVTVEALWKKKAAVTKQFGHPSPTRLQSSSSSPLLKSFAFPWAFRWCFGIWVFMVCSQVRAPRMRFLESEHSECVSGSEYSEFAFEPEPLDFVPRSRPSDCGFGSGSRSSILTQLRVSQKAHSGYLSQQVLSRGARPESCFHSEGPGGHTSEGVQRDLRTSFSPAGLGLITSIFPASFCLGISLSSASFCLNTIFSSAAICQGNICVFISLNHFELHFF